MSSDAATIKPWHRLRYWLLAGLVLLAVTIGWMALETRRHQLSEPNPNVDFRAQFHEYMKQHADLGPDGGVAAWEMLVQALSAADEELSAFSEELAQQNHPPRYEYDYPEPDFFYVTQGASIPADAQRERIAIDRLRKRGVMDDLAKFVQLGPGREPRQGEMSMFTQLMQFQTRRQVREVVMMRRASMRVALEDGDEREVAAAFKQMLAIGHSISLQPGLINGLMANAIQAIALQELGFALLEAELDAQTLTAIDSALDRYKPPTATYILTGERAIIDDYIQHAFSDNGRGNGWMVAEVEFNGGTVDAKSSFADAFLTRFILADRRQTQAVVDEAFDAILIESAKPIAQRWQAFDPDAFADSLSWRHHVWTLIPEVARAVTTFDAAQSEHQASRIMVALAKYHREHGAYPAALDELVPTLLPSVPVDPLHQGPYGYRLLNNDEHGRPYLLYSYGCDATDNGGETPRGELFNTSAMTSADSHGYDRLFTYPRPEWQQ